MYRLQEIQASLESWFLQVTSRLGRRNGDCAGADLSGSSGGALGLLGAITGDRRFPPAP